MNVTELFKLAWMRLQQRGTLYASRNEQFDKLYRISDPWQMESEREQFRFQETNRVIEQEVGKVGTLLEVGCGEGHQSEYLSRLCERLYAFDVSKNAVDRAKRRCPAAEISMADIFSYRPAVKKFDLVVACEVLYYVKDVPAAIHCMSKLASRCLVTYYQSGPCVLDPFFSHVPGMKSRVMQAGGVSWKAVCWDTEHVPDESFS